MADLDYGALKLFPGNYDAYMTAATAGELVQNENAKKKTQIAELQAFVSRFSANSTKAKQATSRARQIEKIELTEVKPSSRQSPFIRFDLKQKLHRQAVTLRELTKGYGGEPLVRDFSIQVEAGERIAIIGPNGDGKTTLLRCLMGELAPDGGELKWAEMADIGYYAQDHAADFAEDVSLFDWMALPRIIRKQTTQVKAIMDRLYTVRASTCYRLLDSLSSTAPNGEPILVLELLNTFYDDDIPLRTRLLKFRDCCRELKRLSYHRPVMVMMRELKDEAYNKFIPALSSVTDHTVTLETELDPISQPTLF